MASISTNNRFGNPNMNHDFLDYQRARFRTQLPRSYRYTASHFWVCSAGPDTWKIGLTAFALRMLGELVEHEWQAQPNSPITRGQTLGWLDGFKAATDIYAIADGTFLTGNPDLKRNIDLLAQDCYGTGWLYMVKGVLDPDIVDAEQYGRILDATIDQARTPDHPQEPDCGH